MKGIFLIMQFIIISMLNFVKYILAYASKKRQKMRQQSYQQRQYYNSDKLKFNLLILLTFILLLMIIISILLWMMNPILMEKEEMIDGLIRDQTNTNIAIEENLSKTNELKNLIQQYQKQVTKTSIEKQSMLKRVQGKFTSIQRKIRDVERKQYMARQNNNIWQKQNQKPIAEVFRIREKLAQINKEILNLQRSSQSHIFYQEVPADYPFLIPKNVWIFKEVPENYLQARYMENIKYHTQANGFHFRVIDENSIDIYIPANQAEILKKVLENLSKKYSGQLLNSLKKTFILLKFLHIHGGIMINGHFGFTQNFNWMNKILTNQIVNRGNRYPKPQIIGFYSPLYAKDKQKFNIKPYENMEEVDKYITEIPAIQQFFLAADKNTEFLGQVIERMYSFVKKIETFNSLKFKYGLKEIRYKQIYKQHFFSACQMVLIDKQRQIDSALKQSYKQFAFDYYGLNLINAYYGPFKMEMIYEGNYFIINRAPQLSHHRVYHDMSRYTEKQYLSYIGSIKYIYIITYETFMNKYLQGTSKGENIQIYQGSFLQKFLFPQGKHSFIVKNPQKPFVNETNAQWNLQRNVWVYWDKGIKNAPIFVQLCIQNIRQSAVSSGFNLIELNDQNIPEYIQASYLNRIQYSFRNAKVSTVIQTKGDLYRLAVLILHGGIYLDSTTITVQNFDWILKIGRFPSQYIFNRFGETPSVLMYWHPYVGHPQQWDIYHINYDKNIKHQWHESLENSFIVGEKGSQFLKDWFNLFLQLLLHPYSEIESVFQKNGIYKHKSTSPTFHYLLAMDSAKCVLGIKQKSIKDDPNSPWINANHYYKIWTFNSFLSPFKLWNKSNYQNPGGALSQDNIPFLYRYSLQFVESIVGNLHFIIKQFKSQTKFMNQLIKDHMGGNYTIDTHSRSFFMKFLWRSNYRVEYSNKNTLQLLVD